MNSIMERWIGSCHRGAAGRTLIWNRRYLMTVLRGYEDIYNTHRPHRTPNQAAPLRPLPDGVTITSGPCRAPGVQRPFAVTSLCQWDALESGHEYSGCQ
jgi:hypothetical protein